LSPIGTYSSQRLDPQWSHTKWSVKNEQEESSPSTGRILIPRWKVTFPYTEQEYPLSCWALVAHTCNPSYSGGSDQEDRGPKSAQANSSWDPISKIPNTKQVWWVAGCLLSKREVLSSKPSTAKLTTTLLFQRTDMALAHVTYVWYLEQ
jgi:hypothetical protein